MRSNSKDQTGPKSRKRRVLLLNPPGDRFYLRDYYCSSVSKSGYYWHPIDLLVLSGRLDGAGYGPRVIDAIAERLSPEGSRRRIREERPEIVIFLTSATSWRMDGPFLEGIAAETGARMIGCGEIFLGDMEGLFRETPWLEAGIRNFTDPGIPGFLESGERCAGIVTRGSFGVETGARPAAEIAVPAEQTEPLRYGLPRHELFPLKRYRYPYHRYHPFASILTSYGCPFRCRFCNSGSLGFRVRDMGEIRRELDHIRDLGIRQLFVKDMSFGAPAGHAREFCGLFGRAGLSMSWNCYARLSSLDVPLLESMSLAGCHLVQMGLETANPAVGRNMGKELDPGKALEVFGACRRLGIRVGAHFVLGLPGETEQGIRETVSLARRLNPDYCSFNLFVPRHGSALDGLLEADACRGPEGGMVLDPSEAFPTRTFCDLDPARLFRWRSRAYRSFYLRPGFLLGQAFRWRTRTELAGVFRDAWGLARNLVRRPPTPGGPGEQRPRSPGFP